MNSHVKVEITFIGDLLQYEYSFSESNKRILLSSSVDATQLSWWRKQLQSLDYLDHLNNPEHISLEGITPEEEVIQKIPASFAYDNKVFPISLIDGVLTVAMIDPLNVLLVDEMRLISGYEIQPVQAEDSEIEDMIVLF